jgi:hypothetical protein
MDEILRVKEELAESYIKEFKKELGFLKWGIFSMFEKKIKWLMLSENDLWDTIDSIWLNFFEKLIVGISPKTAEKIFNFIKEKKEKLQKAKTKSELDDLQSDVISSGVDGNISWTDIWSINDNNDSFNNWSVDNTDKSKKSDSNNYVWDESDDGGVGSINAWLTTAWVWWSVVLWVDKYWRQLDINWIKKLHPEIDKKSTKELFVKMKSDFDDLSKSLSKQADNPKITKVMRKNILKSSKEFESAIKDLDKWGIDAFESWRKLWNKLPESMIKSISPRESKILLDLWDDFFDQIKNMDNISDIQKLLKSKWINWMSDETLKVLKSASNPWEMKLMVNVLSKAKNVRNVLRAVKWVALLDVLFLWLDVWMYVDTKKEAELLEKVNSLRVDAMRNKANLQLRVVGVWWAALSIFATCLAVSSLWWLLWIALWVLVWWAAVLVNHLIEKSHEKNDVYLKNEEDYKREYRSEIKQSILQVVAAKQWNLNSRLRKKIDKQRWSDIQTVKDWFRSLIWLEEYENPEYYLLQSRYSSGLSEDDFKSKLEPDVLDDYNKQKELIDKQINFRMEYISKYLYENKASKEYKTFIKEISDWNWISVLEKVLAESKIYKIIKDDQDQNYISSCKTLDEYNKKYLEKIKSENSLLFDTFESKVKDIKQLQWIYNWVLSYKYIVDQNKNTPEIAPYYDIIKNNVNFIEQYYFYKTLWLTYEQKNSLKSDYSDFDYNYIENILKDPSKIDSSFAYSSDQIRNYFDSWWLENKLESYYEVSDSVWQNIIYRIAKEIHWYKWSNDMVELIWFFIEAKKNNLWIYYDYEWKINVHKARIASNDVSFNFADFEDKDWYEKIMKYLGSSYDNFDSALDNVDDEININYKAKINDIIKEEMSYKNPQVKKQIEEDILNYVKINSWNINNDLGNSVWYVDIPYHMLVKAKKSGIWNLQKFMFKYHNSKYFALTSWNYISDSLNFDQTKTSITREYMKKIRNSLSSEEMQYINYVDSAHKKLEELRSIKASWSKEDELDIPIEYERSISQMVKKRKDFKESLLYLDPVIVKEKLNDNYLWFYDYFESMYVWLLSVVDKNKISNDIDDSNYMSQAYNFLNREVVYMDKNTDSIKLINWILREWSEKNFYELVDKKLYENKSLKEIFIENKNKWIWLSRQIIKSILESVVVNIDNKWTVVDIENGYFNYVDEKKLEKALKINLWKKYFEWVNYNSWYIDTDQSDIVEADKDSLNVANQANNITNKIESTMANVDRSGKRWNIKFDIESNAILSWDNKIAINIIWEKIKIKWLDIQLDIKQWVWLANFINRLKYNYVWKYKFDYSRWMRKWWWIYIDNRLWQDTQIISRDVLKENCSFLFDQNNIIKSEFINYINSL